MKMIVAIAALASATAATNPAPPLERVPVLDAQLPAANPPVRKVHGARIGFAPGQLTGLHRHAMSVVGVVTRGSILFQAEGEAPRVLRQGDSFFEAAGHPTVHFDNASHTEKAEIVAFYLTDDDARPLIEKLD